MACEGSAAPAVNASVIGFRIGRLADICGSVMRFLSTTALACSLLAASVSAQAADRHVTVTNKTTYTISSFQASNIGTSDWEEDILGDDTLDPGQRVAVDLDDSTGACHFDFLATFEDNTTAQKHDVNVCEISEFDFTE